jgi:hypothetical protein
MNSLFKQIIEALPKEPTDGFELWTNGDEILGKDMERVEGVADLLESLGYDTNTGYYDPEEDSRNHETDRNTGYYYATIF